MLLLLSVLLSEESPEVVLARFITLLPLDKVLVVSMDEVEHSDEYVRVRA